MERHNKPQRSRKKPVRKWSYEQQKVLINYIRHNLPIEKPTARAYYDHFFQQTRVPIEWELVRSKVRNLRVRYTQAKLWKTSDEALLLTEEQRRTRLLKMCSFYDDFEEISHRYEMSVRLNDFSHSKRRQSKEVHLDLQEDRVSPRNTISSGIGDSDNDQVENEHDYNPVNINVKIEEELSLTESTNVSNVNSNEPSDSSYVDHTLKVIYDESFDHHNDEVLQDGSAKAKNNRYLLQKQEFKQRKLDLEIEKFNFKKEKFTKQHELRKWEVESQERIRKLELEMQERIAMRQLNIKARFASIKFKQKCKDIRPGLLKH